MINWISLMSHQVKPLFRCIRGRWLTCWKAKRFTPVSMLPFGSWHLSVWGGNQAALKLETSASRSVVTFMFLCVASTLFSGLRGGTFMCALSRLNSRMKHLLFGTLLQQDVHFFEKNDAGEIKSTLKRRRARWGNKFILKMDSGSSSDVSEH